MRPLPDQRKFSHIPTQSEDGFVKIHRLHLKSSERCRANLAAAGKEPLNPTRTDRLMGAYTAPSEKHIRKSKNQAESDFSATRRGKRDFPRLMNVAHADDQLNQSLFGPTGIQKFQSHHPGCVGVIKTHRDLTSQIK